ncbi:alpha/beta hydrolase [Labilithrix luteola]|uniref:alpha/beta hydrolase n=1 Tax=Labilithrix luteola TaxID=1391654 RepID=UPI0011BAD08D|nr:alpha/beta fold hydrolase [Labilithrix luteola]
MGRSRTCDVPEPCQLSSRTGKNSRLLTGISALVGLTTMVVAPAASADGDAWNSSCDEVNFNVTLDGAPGNYRIAGEICKPRFGQNRTLQILIHGASYNRTYWNFPYKPAWYSYVRHANLAGYTTIALDRLGHGASDHPPGPLVTVHESANTIHQIVTAIRNGSATDATGHPIHFDKIVLVGHSFGSNISWTEAGIYGDVDGIVLTGISHLQNPPGAPLTVTYAYPAEYDPKFAASGIQGYLTTIPGKRGEMFYYLPGASSQAISVDEDTKDVVPFGLLFDQFTTYGLTQNIHVPVLNVTGNYDTLACDLPSCTGSGTLSTEGSNYPADACFTQYIVPNAGHSINMHYSAPLAHAYTQDWVNDMVEHRRSPGSCRRH